MIIEVSSNNNTVVRERWPMTRDYLVGVDKHHFWQKFHFSSNHTSNKFQPCPGLLFVSEFAASWRRSRSDSGSDITGGSELGGRTEYGEMWGLQCIILWSHQTSDTLAGNGSHGSGRDQDMLPLHLPDLPLQCDPPDELHHPMDPLQHPVQSGEPHCLRFLSR